MGKTVRKAPACLGVAATAKARPILLVKKHGRFCLLPEKKIFYSENFA
jgi:hypothetical protein